MQHYHSSVYLMHNGEPPPKCIQIAENVLDCLPIWIKKKAVSSLQILLDLWQLGPEFWSVSGMIIKWDIMWWYHLVTKISIAVIKQILLFSQAPLPIWAILAWSRNGLTAWNSLPTYPPQPLPFGNHAPYLVGQQWHQNCAALWLPVKPQEDAATGAKSQLLSTHCIPRPRPPL